MVDAADTRQLSLDDMISEMRAGGVDVSHLEPSNGNIYGEGRKPETAEDRQTKWMDYPKAMATGVTGAVSGLGAAIEYGTDGEYGTSLRKAGEAGSKAISDTISPAGQHALNASFLPGEGDDSAYKEGILRTVGMQGAASLFSLASSIIPGTMAGKIALRMGASATKAGGIGAGVARGSAALQNAGGSAEQIHSALDGMTDQELMNSPAYRQMRDQGMSEQQARSRLYQKVDGIAPILNGALTYMLAAPEANAAKAGVAGAAKRQGARGVLKNTGQEGFEEGGEGAAQEATSEDALNREHLGPDLDPYKVAGQALTGAVTGAAMGAGTGLYTHGFVAPDEKLAIEQSLGSPAPQPQQAVPVGPAATSPADTALPSSNGEPTVPEAPETLAMQAQQLAEGKRNAVLIPEGNPENVPIPQGMASEDTSEGTVYYNPTAVRREEVMAAVLQGEIGSLLGYVQTKPEAAAASAQQGVPPQAVVSRNAQGVEQDAAVVSPDRAADQARVFAERAQPGSTVGTEPADYVLQGRLNQTPTPPNVADAVRRAAPSDEIGDAGLNPVPAQADPDLIRYDDGTVRPANEPPVQRSRPPERAPLWPTPEQFDKARSPDYANDAEDYYAERDAARDPLEGPAPDDDFEPWQDFEPTSEVTPAGVGPLGRKALGGTTSASKRQTRRGKAELIAKKSREARYAALQGEPAEAAPVGGTTTASRRKTRRGEAALIAAKSREARYAALREAADEPAPSVKLGPKALEALSRKTAEEPTKEKSADDRHISDKQKAADKKLAKAAETAFGKTPIVEEQTAQGALFKANKIDPRDVSKLSVRHSLKARLRKYLAAVEKAGGQLPKNASKFTPDHVRYALAARNALKALESEKFGPYAREAVVRFLAVDDAARKGDFSLVRDLKQDVVDGIGTAGMETRAEVTDEVEGTPDEVDEEFKGRLFREQLLGEISRQIKEDGAVDLAALRNFAKGIDAERAKRLRTLSEEQLRAWASQTEAQSSKPTVLDMPARLERFADAVIGEVQDQRRKGRDLDFAALNAVARRTDKSLAASAVFKSAQDVDNFLERERVRKERRRSVNQKPDAGRRVGVDRDTENELVAKFDGLKRSTEESERKAEKYEDLGKIKEFEEFVAADVQEAGAQDLAKKQRETDAAARKLQKEGAQRFSNTPKEQVDLPELRNRLQRRLSRATELVKKLGEAASQNAEFKVVQRDIGDLQQEIKRAEAKQRPVTEKMFSKGAFSDEDSADAQLIRDLEDEAFFQQSDARIKDGRSALRESENPSVLEAGNDTVIRDNGHHAKVLESTTVGELINRGLRLGPTNPRLMEFVKAIIIKNAADVPVHIVTLEDVRRLSGMDASGYYEPNGRYIVLPWEAVELAPEKFNSIVVHEALHAALAHKLNGNLIALSQIHALGEYLLAYGGIKKDHYLWTNTHEFLSEVFSRAELQEQLRNTPLTPELAKILGVDEWRQKTVWRAIIDKIAEWLGYHGPMNALEGAISIVERIDSGDISANLGVANYVKDALPEPYDRIGVLSTKFDTPSNQSQLNFDFDGASKLASKGVFSKESVTNKVTDAKDTFSSSATGADLIFKTLDQIRQVYKSFFTNGSLDRAIATIQKIAPYAATKRKAFDEAAQRFLDLAKKSPKVADQLADLMVDATVANVQLGDGATNEHLKGWHSWQGKLARPALERQYNALPVEAKQLYNDLKKLFRETQNEMARGLVANDLADGGVSPPDLNKFIDRVMANKLTEADKSLFASKPTLLKNIMNAAQARVVKGDYFPLMRNGHKVIVTIREIKDTMGGTEIEKGQVEFRGKTFKQAQAKAEAFAAKMYKDGFKVMNVTPTPVSTDSDYGVVVKVQRLGFHTFESEMEARAWRRENEGDFDQVSPVQDGLETGLNSADLTIAQRNKMLNALKRQEGISDEMKEAMQDVFQQVAAGLMSGNRIQQRSITRRKIQGASKDYGRILVQYGEAASANLARIKFMPEFRAAHDEMSAQVKDKMDKHTDVRVKVMNELAKRVDTGVEKPNEPPRWMQTAMSLTFLGRLASPMHSVVNGMQVGMVTYPVLSARYGPVRAARMLMDAYGAVGVSEQVMAGLKNTYRAGKNLTDISLDLEDTGGSIRNNLKSQKDAAELSKLIDMLQERGAMAVGGFELAQSVSRGQSRMGRVIAQLDRAARQLPSAVEDVNRAVSAVAAYRLARSSMTEEKAREYAFDVVMNTQGDYSGVNAPRFFNNNYLRPALQFKKYAQMMTMLIGSAAKHAVTGPAIEGMTADERNAAKWEARRFLLNIAAVQIATAGALSLPGIELAKLAFMTTAALGLGGGWDDEEEKLIKLAEETFGEDWGRMLTKGVLSRAIGLDFSQKLSLGDMWTAMGEPKSSDEDGIGAYLAKQMFGAPYSSLSDTRQGIEDLGKGEVIKGLGKIIPIKVLGDAFKAADAYSEGKATATEVGLNVLGVRTGRQSEQGRKAGAGVRQTRQYEEARHEISQEYLKAQNAGERAKLRARIAAHNRQVPLRYRVFPNALDQFVRKRIEEERVN